MKVQQLQQNNIQKQPQFRGAGDAFLRYLATNQAVGANGVDLAFMVIPRTTTDMVGRGPAAGLETARREASGTANHSLIGVYGLGSGLATAALMGIDKKFGTKVNTIFAAPETLNILAENKANQIKNGKQQIEYLKETLSNIKAFNPTAIGADKDGFVRLADDTVDEVAKILDGVISNKNLNFKEWNSSKTADSINVVINKITEKTGAQAKYVLESADKKIASTTDLKTFLEDLFKVSKSFNEEKVSEAFLEQVRNNKSIKENAFVQKLSKFMKTRAGAGFALATAVGMSIQPLNIYLTKKKTGSDGFVGVEGRTKDTSTEFKLMKGAAGAGFFGLTLATLGTGLKGFMDKMAFKGFWPTLSQLKGVYGLTIISRLLATRDKDELREALTKDTLGFLSWLVLGDIVNKMAAEGLDKSVMNRTEEVSKQNFFKRVFNSSLKTRDEVLIETLAKNGVDTVKKDGEKTIAKTFKEMMKDLDNLAPEIKKATKKRLGTLNKAQLAGYAFSGLVLGLGIPNLNIYITNKLDKKRKAKLAEEAQKQQAIA
ncbi:MAG: hypothetical protein E7Z92_00575 [Cyanobacteria bacterium SIG31]|nr:hypothetical protein [Cyanobacteria bacterium SIG31]